MTAKILITGGTGQVGTALRHVAGDACTAPNRQQLDLLDPGSIAHWIGSQKWRAVVNCAAYTAVDRAESEPELAEAINSSAPGHIAHACAAHNIPLIHISTDYVFDGTKKGYYTEDDPVSPIGIYGRTKEAGEAAVRAACPAHVILRTAWVVSPWGQNFIKTMLRLGAERDVLRVVADQQGCPTSAQDIAAAIFQVLNATEAHRGTYHFVNAGEASWHDLATAVFERAQMHDVVPPRIDAISTAEYPTPAARPANSRLATARFEQDFGFHPRPWRQAVHDIVDALIAA